MAKFVLVFTGGGMPESEEEQAKVLAAWGAWYEGLGEAVVDPGNPFSPAVKKHDQRQNRQRWVIRNSGQWVRHFAG